MASEAENLKSFEVQAGYCRAMDAPVTTRLVEALPAALRDKSCLCPRCAQVEAQLQAAVRPIP